MPEIAYEPLSVVVESFIAKMTDHINRREVSLETILLWSAIVDVVEEAHDCGADMLAVCLIYAYVAHDKGYGQQVIDALVGYAVDPSLAERPTVVPPTPSEN